MQNLLPPIIFLYQHVIRLHTMYMSVELHIDARFSSSHHIPLPACNKTTHDVHDCRTLQIDAKFASSHHIPLPACNKTTHDVHECRTTHRCKIYFLPFIFKDSIYFVYFQDILVSLTPGLKLNTPVVKRQIQGPGVTLWQ